MNNQARIELEPIFQAVLQIMEQNRLKFNQADTINGNHGDHMVAIFRAATRAAKTYRQVQIAGPALDNPPPNDLSEAMEFASQQLKSESENGSARIYALGLSHLATQFRRYNIELADLVPYIQSVVQDSKLAERENDRRSGDVLKSLLAALAGWRQPEGDQDEQVNPLDMGTMFDLGIAYVQAKQRNPTRREAIADAAASVSPLGSVPHRYLSSKIAILALLQALSESALQ